MTNGDEANEAVERLVKSTQDSCGAVVDHAVGLQERDVLFAQRMVEGSIRELRQQSESNWEMAQELFEWAEEHGEALRGLIQESIEAYVDFLHLPFAYYGEGLEAARKGTARWLWEHRLAPGSGLRRVSPTSRSGAKGNTEDVAARALRVRNRGMLRGCRIHTLVILVPLSPPFSFPTETGTRLSLLWHSGFAPVAIPPSRPFGRPLGSVSSVGLTASL